MRQEEQDDATESVATDVAEAPIEPGPEVDAQIEDTTATEDEAAEDEPAETPTEQEPAPKRRRLFPWRRAKSAETAESVQEAPVPAATAEGAAAEAETGAEDQAQHQAETDSETIESESGASESGALVEEEQPEPEPEPVLVPHRTAGRGLKVAAIAVGTLFVGATAFAGATIQPYLTDRAVVHTKLEIAETAQNAIQTLWTYTPDDMDALPDRAGRYLAGDFAVEYRRYIDAIVESNKQAQVSNSTQVLGVAVESFSPTEASAIVYTNSVATSPRTKGIPSLRYLSYRLDMEPRDRQWLITKMTAITSLDLTPRL